MALNLDGLASSASASKVVERKVKGLPHLDSSWGAKGLASALDQLGIVSVTDAEGCIVHANDEFVRVSKYTREELLGQNHRMLNSSHHSKEFWDEAFRKLAKGQPWRSPVKNRAKDGGFYWVDALIVPLKGRNRRTKGYLSVQIDITVAVTLHIAAMASRPHSWEPPTTAIERSTTGRIIYQPPDLTAGEEVVLAAGATRHEHQPSTGGGFVVYLDPAGHPFCLVS